MIVKFPAGGGVNNDQMPEELPLGVWQNALNVRFRNGYAEKARGIRAVMTTPVVTPYWLAPFQTATKKFWIHAGTAAVYADDGTTQTDITGTAPTGAVDNRWTGGTLNGVFVCNNGVDKPFYWNGDTATNLATLTSWDANELCQVIRPWRNYLFALNISKSGTKYPYMVKWSSAADPGALPASWDETDPSNDAGELDLAETPDILVDCLPLGERLGIYKERSMYAARYIGGQFIFQFVRLPGDVGMLAPGCAVQVPQGHVVLTAGDVVLNTGQGVQSICDGSMRRYIFDNMDSTNYKRSFVTANPSKNEVWVCFPAGGETTCTRAAVWNWIENTWAIRSLPNVTYGAFGQVEGVAGDAWNTVSGTWNESSVLWSGSEYSPNEARLLFSTTAPYIALADSGGTDFGTNISTSMERYGIPLDDAQGRKLIRGVWPRIDSVPGTTLTISVGASMTPDVAPTYSSSTTFTVGTDAKVDTFASGRYLAIKIESATSAPWRMRGFDVDVVPAGVY